MTLSDQQRQRIDAEMHAHKLRDGCAERNYRRALEQQVKANPNQWGIA